MKKIKNSGIRKYFRKVLVTKNNKIDEIVKVSKELKFVPKEKIILVDDRPEQLEKTEQKKKSVLTFHLCRPEGRYSDLICLNKDWEAKSLKEVLRILRNEAWI